MNKLTPIALACFAYLTGACRPNFELSSPDEPRFLDRVCNDNACLTSGIAARCSGITGDSTGFRIGAGSGSVRIPLKNIAMVSSQGELSLLIAGTGQVEASVVIGSKPLIVNQIMLEENYAWRTLSINATSEDTSSLVLILQTNDSSKAQLADLRAKGFADTYGCDVSSRPPNWGFAWLLLAPLLLIRRKRCLC